MVVSVWEPSRPQVGALGMDRSAEAGKRMPGRRRLIGRLRRVVGNPSNRYLAIKGVCDEYQDIENSTTLKECGGQHRRRVTAALIDGLSREGDKRKTGRWPTWLGGFRVINSIRRRCLRASAASTTRLVADAVLPGQNSLDRPGVVTLAAVMALQPSPD